MMERRASDYWLPPAWRGVASPAHLYAARWHALVDELGGLRAPTSDSPSIGEGTRTNPFSQAGLGDTSVLTEVQETEQLDELREFVLRRLAPHERLVLMLVYAERLSLRQVAEVLDLPEPSVKGIYARTMAKVRAQFSQSG